MSSVSAAKLESHFPRKNHVLITLGEKKINQVIYRMRDECISLLFP